MKTFFPISINGQIRSVSAQQTVAAALATHADSHTRCSPGGQTRAPLCGMGVCQECRVNINGKPHQLACQTYCQPGMRVLSAEYAATLPAPPQAQAAYAGASPAPSSGAASAACAAPSCAMPPAAAQQATEPISAQVFAQVFDVVVIGAGPGGQAAAVAAAQQGRSVALVDDNPLPGGQIWRAAQLSGTAPRAATESWARVCAHSNIVWLAASKIVRASDDKSLLLQGALHNTAQAAPTPPARLLRYEKLILATGARERLLPFPGWTLPGVTGLGGLQALAKGGYHLYGKRVVLAGSGPLLLAVAATLRERGAHVVCILEQSSRANLLRFGLGLWRTPNKLAQAASLGWQLLGIAYHSNSYVLTAQADAAGTQLASVRVRRGKQEQDIACDYLACAYGLLPNTRLAQSLGCALTTHGVQVNQQQQTSQADIWCVGEACGVGGVDKARIEGEIAGLAACALPVQHLQAERARWQDFAARLQQAFAPRAELHQLADVDTIICRCEDVRLGQLAEFDDWRSAKLQTRCGMGACQGLVCGAALESLRAWPVDGLRAPLTPSRIGTLLQQ